MVGRLLICVPISGFPRCRRLRWGLVLWCCLEYMMHLRLKGVYLVRLCCLMLLSLLCLLCGSRCPCIWLLFLSICLWWCFLLCFLWMLCFCRLSSCLVRGGGVAIGSSCFCWLWRCCRWSILLCRLVSRLHLTIVWGLCLLLCFRLRCCMILLPARCSCICFRSRVFLWLCLLYGLLVGALLLVRCLAGFQGIGLSQYIAMLLCPGLRCFRFRLLLLSLMSLVLPRSIFRCHCQLLLLVCL